MTYPTPEMVVSGVPYLVVEVEGRVPSSLADFVTATRFVVQDGDGTRSVAGEGHHADDAVRFHEKAGDGEGKDLRVWCVRPGDGGFTAEVV